ncbi:FabD/lysophospholipase-like protein [Glonium stellatum]|uniref:FabD/lysophospholipase-like protein n=1 Tax=Glonium stellatum TaxID=574774 RepID=A0A8E2EVF9_9PEZI|nr:FabD/lysophospholipase-like protein [Glonium stellatum]
MPDKELRLLALDGGGVRGLSALMILERLMEAVNPDSPPKPCDYFDMIGGTSTGGLIAIMLGRLRMSIDECIVAYLSLSDRVFQKKRHRVTIKGNIQERFSSEELTRAVKEVIKEQGLQENVLLKDAPEAACKVFVCATSKQSSETVCLTSYKSPRGNSDLLNSVKIWEACRATSAASSFFDPIPIGRYKEEFVDGATGANNPVWEIWNQAQMVWGPEPLENKIKCLISIGTGVPSLKPFQDDLFHIGETLVAIATETEQTAERFRRDKSHLDNTGRYYRFNVARGLEDIGFEESKKSKEIAAATRRYIGSQDVLKQMQACADNVAGREYFGEYRTVFSLEGAPRVSKFVDRPDEMAELERVLLSKQQSCRQRIFVLRGLGGIGKTQLAVEFARRHHRRFSSVFWLDGRSEESLRRSIASCASKIPQGQIPETSRAYSSDSSINIGAVVKDVMDWLAQPANTAWLLIFDNVDREDNPRGTDPDAYDVKRYLSGADHGCVIITTRLAKLEQLGDPLQLRNVDTAQAQAIFKNWYKRDYDIAESERLLKQLGGLPLAIAQAGAYLQESGVRIGTYLTFYDQQWSELMGPQNSTDGPLEDYPDRSVGTTWAISYKAIRDKNEATANLLLLWSFLDNKDLWHGLFTAACQYSTVVERSLSEWIGDIASNGLEFSRAMQLLRSYSLIEDVEELESYATHPVVHRWAYHYQGKCLESMLAQLAVMTVGWAIPHESTQDYWIMQRRLLPHAQPCSQWVLTGKVVRSSGSHGEYDMDSIKREEKEEILAAIHCLGSLYADQGKLAEAEKI